MPTDVCYAEQVSVNALLDPTVPYDLLLVPVKCHQVAEALPTLQASAAKTIMFNSVTFSPLALMRDAVGAERFAYGFTKFPVFMKQGKLAKIDTFLGMKSICWARADLVGCYADNAHLGSLGTDRA